MSLKFYILSEKIYNKKVVEAISIIAPVLNGKKKIATMKQDLLKTKKKINANF